MNIKQLNNKLKDRHQLELGQTTSEYAVALTVISGSSTLLVDGFSRHVATVVLGVVRLLP